MSMRLAYWGQIAGLLLFPLLLSAQVADTSSRKVEIIHADILRLSEIPGDRITSLSGAVQLRQEGMLMECDSALIYQQTNTVYAYGRVKIIRQSLLVKSQQLVYSGNERFARLSGGVMLNRDKMTLRTPSLDYDMNSGISTYLYGGEVVKGTTRIVSRKGDYNENTELVYFRDSVVVTDPDFRITADTLQFNRSTEKLVFFPRTTIYNEKNRIECQTGIYDLNNSQATFGSNTLLHSPPQRLAAEHLFYDRNNGIAIMEERFHWKDSSMQAEIFAFKGRYEERYQQIRATQDPLLITRADQDTLWLTADTLLSRQQSSADSFRLFFAWQNVRLFSKGFQGVCDSLTYSFQDSVFHFYQQPVLWTEGIQIHGDTLSLQTKNNKPDYLYARKQAWVISLSDSALSLYDQITGVYLHGYFANTELEKVQVVQNAESLYFGKTEKGIYEGVNKSRCAQMWLHFADKKLSQIRFLQKPEAVYTPIRKFPKSDYQLKGFRLESSRRPLSPRAIAPLWVN